MSTNSQPFPSDTRVKATSPDIPGSFPPHPAGMTSCTCRLELFLCFWSHKGITTHGTESFEQPLPSKCYIEDTVLHSFNYSNMYSSLPRKQLRTVMEKKLLCLCKPTKSPYGNIPSRYPGCSCPLQAGRASQGVQSLTCCPHSLLLALQQLVCISAEFLTNTLPPAAAWHLQTNPLLNPPWLKLIPEWHSTTPTRSWDQ